MTYAEYCSLEVGDVVYHIDIRHHKMTIEPRRVVLVGNVPFHYAFMSGEGYGFFKTLGVDRNLCFLNLSEASRKLEEIINKSNQKQKEKANDLAKKYPNYKFTTKEIVAI